MCEFIEDSHLMPGWVCCSCREYNGFQRSACKRCLKARHPITMPDGIKQCDCGFAYRAVDWIRKLSGEECVGRCPVCGAPLGDKGRAKPEPLQRPPTRVGGKRESAQTKRPPQSSTGMGASRMLPRATAESSHILTPKQRGILSRAVNLCAFDEQPGKAYAQLRREITDILDRRE